MMDYMIIVLAISGFVGCYDVAVKMSLRTHHGIRVALIVTGVGCVFAAFLAYQFALIALLAGVGLFRAFDRRSDGVRDKQ